MKKIVWALTVLAGVGAVACVKKSTQPQIIAHRGFWNTENSAQNSVTALTKAIELGCFGAEFDVQLTSDGVPVVFHDNTTPNGTDLQNVDYNTLINTADPLPNGEKIPTLAQYLFAWNHAKTKLILEIKPHRDAGADQRAAQVIMQTIRAFGTAPEEIEFISFSQATVKALAELEFGAPIAYLSGDLTPDEAQALGATGIDYQMDVLRQNHKWISQAHKLGMTVNVWTVTTPEEAAYFAKKGVDYITTDIPEELRITN
ncbi:MAG: glycerophosphodiester phosphodiesterase [Alistipes sp.]|jgi:glycerophosphoryl diester phosphodiesterase|nr:glycerophosphodiester phosphodiesterase [Alistipes sp.]